MAEFFRKKKKVCQMCAGKPVDYKNPEILRKYITEKGKILPRRATGTCQKHQRWIATQIKRARMIALLPFAK
ncbi:MAG: 30S ribosomal protein S18 [Bacilli bacterium]|nr:30S ribosomal protein S18 [Bacilli bacterium]